MKTFLTFLFVLMFASVLFAEDKPAKRMDNYIAVFDLETQDVDKENSLTLTENIRGELAMSGKYEIIDRASMNKILGGEKFQMSGCVAGQCIVEAGQLLGVGKIIAGSMSRFGKTYYLSLSIIDVQTGNIENVAEDDCKYEIADLLKSSKRLAKKLLEEKVAEAQATQETRTTLVPARTEETTSASQKPPPGTDAASGMEFIFVKGGCYQMGDIFEAGKSWEKPVHEVCVDDFYLGKYDVTQGQWKAIMGNNPSDFKNCGDNCPVENVSWDDTQDFINNLNQRTGKSYRLPAEAEWEYAARSGGKNEKWAGTSNESELGDYAWYISNSGGMTHPVGQKKPNGLGLYDMSGNVWQWVQDCYDGSYYKDSPGNNPTGPDCSFLRVLRGGAWNIFATVSRTANRDFYNPDFRYNTIGFRLARTKF